MTKCEITTMVMIEDKNTEKILVQDRVKNWKGLSFPGGHVENGECFYDCAVREVKEETGLDISNLEYCGIIHWVNNKTLDRYLVFLYKTTVFSGKLIAMSDEGKNMWITIDELRNAPSENQTCKYLPMFLEGKYSEAFGSWNDEEPWDIIYK
ncbi:MAG: 8-oxo-dGTP diphosphatase [Eubacteriales bacterium]|nr:8-oxo-dGTP diphosphatase [Oscillospiraceae bacterium]MDD4494834.1 8-oxo-dGTP diphosphatase [Eubacteriales bacterium]